jgi:hypothetical protein
MPEGPALVDQPPRRSGNQPDNGLTCIHARIHCVATNGEADCYTESERVMVETFLETLAEVALSVAARKGI